MSKPISSEHLRTIFGLKVKTYRHERGLSLAQLAARSGVAVSYISEIEQGKKYPKPEKMLQLAQGLGVEFDELVSLRVDKALDPLAALLESELIKEFPFDLFGISARDILNLFADAPQRATAFLQTFLEISRSYDMTVENFLLAALRTYQKLNRNYFTDIEAAAQEFLDTHPDVSDVPQADELAWILADEHGYRIDEELLERDPELSGFRSVYRDGRPPVLSINPRLLPSQKAFLLAREIGFRRLKIHKVRPTTSSWLTVESFDHLINNFKASYFAGAVMLPRVRLEPDLGDLLAQPTWQDQRLLDMLAKHQATPEMFLYRMSQLLPGVFGLEKLFYLRFTRNLRSGEIRLTKELNLTDELVPYGLGLREHYCRRWLPLQQLEYPLPPTDAAATVPVLGIQRARFLESGSEFLMISLARAMSLSRQKLSAMTIGFKLDGEARRLVRFADDATIAATEVNETCERCPLAADECRQRAAPAVVFARAEKQRRKEEAVRRVLDEAGRPKGRSPAS